MKFKYARNPYADRLERKNGDGGDTLDLKALATSFKQKTDEVKEMAEKAVAAHASGEQLSRDFKESADAMLTDFNGMRARVDELEQKAARGGDDDALEQARKSFGEQFVQSEAFQNLQKSAGQRGKASMEFKAIISSLTTDAAGSAGSAAGQATRIPGIIAPPNRRMTVRDLLTPGRMDTNSLEYIQETGFTNNAGMVAELAAKPQSDLKFTLKQTSPKVIAHYMKASRQILDDASQLQSYINERLLYGLAFREEAQLLNGDGTGQNLLGIIPQATAYANPGVTVTTPTMIDQLRLAMLQAVLAEYPATGHVVNPIDWASIELTKDSEGRYLIAQPQSTVTPTLWGLPVVATQAMQVDKFLTGAFKLGAQLFDRWQARVEIATENEDDFVKNLVTILAEERLALAVYRPQAFIYGEFGNLV